MEGDLITPENLTKELLESIYSAAFMETSWDEDGDLRVKDGIRCYVMPSDRKDRIKLLSIFRFEPKSSDSQRLDCVNKINREYIIVKAVSGKNDSLVFQYEVFVGGGITPKNLILATKLFLRIPVGAVQEHGREIVQ